MAQILDQFGAVIPRGDVVRARTRALVGGGITPYDSADRQAAEMASWNPWLGSPDTETTPYRDISVARIRDLVRNDGWASGAVTKTLDAVVGADFRMASIPDYRALARRFGSKFDAAWAKEFSDAAEAGFRAWGNDPAHYNDTTRRLTFSQQVRLAFRHYLVEGEALSVLPWRDDRRGYGRARYATTVQLVDPDRLSNPGIGNFDFKEFLRGGVELDQDHAPIAYHIRRAHQNDHAVGGKGVQWERIERETAWGRPMVVHFFDDERAGQHRPVGGIFVPVLGRMRMLAQMDRLEVQAAIVNAIFGAYVESPFDSNDVQAALEEENGAQLSKYQEMRSEFHADRRLTASGVRLATLYPGEKISTIASNRPAAAFDMFESAMLRNISSAVGLPYETLSSNYKGSSYSSARQSMLEAWRTISRRRMDFGSGFCSPIYAALLEEMIDRGDVPLPAGAPDFAEARAEYARCRWMGPGRGWIDPTKEPEGARMKIASGLSTLEKEAAENGGDDWEETLDQLELEKAEIARRGLDLTFETKGGAPDQEQKPAGAEAPADA